MKKTLALLLILTISISVFSQFTKGDYSILLNGSYNQGTNWMGVSTNNFTTKGENASASLSVERYRASNFYLGLGLDFQWSNDDVTNSLLSKNFAQFENMNMQSFLVFPFISYGYNLPLADNLSLNLNARVGYGILGTNLSSDYQNYQHPNGGTFAQNQTANENLTWNHSEYLDEFGTSFSPEINYFFSDRFGLSLRLGGIGYTIQEWDKDRSSFSMNFNTNNWRLGIRYII